MFYNWLKVTSISFLIMILLMVVDARQTFSLFDGHVGLFLLFYLFYLWWTVPVFTGIGIIIYDWAKWKFGK